MKKAKDKQFLEMQRMKVPTKEKKLPSVDKESQCEPEEEKPVVVVQNEEQLKERCENYKKRIIEVEWDNDELRELLLQKDRSIQDQIAKVREMDDEMGLLRDQAKTRKQKSQE